MAGCNINKHCRGGGEEMPIPVRIFFLEKAKQMSTGLFIITSGDLWKIHRFWLIYCVCIDEIWM